MQIKNLILENFRNYEREEFAFSDGLNVLFGRNAQGKTNCAEAVFYLCTGASLRIRHDKQLIKIGAESAKITAETGIVSVMEERFPPPMYALSDFKVTFATRPFSIWISSKRVRKCTSPPCDKIYSRIFFTTFFKLSLPIWGFASHKISSGAPKRTKVFNTSRLRGLCVWVLSLPSEKVPAPPSPN